MGTVVPKAVSKDKAEEQPRDHLLHLFQLGQTELNPSCCHGTQHTGKYQLRNRLLQGWGLGLWSV